MIRAHRGNANKFCWCDRHFLFFGKMWDCASPFNLGNLIKLIHLNSFFFFLNSQLIVLLGIVKFGRPVRKKNRVLFYCPQSRCVCSYTSQNAFQLPHGICLDLLPFYEEVGTTSAHTSAECRARCHMIKLVRSTKILSKLYKDCVRRTQHRLRNTAQSQMAISDFFIVLTGEHTSNSRIPHLLKVL